VAEAAPDTVSRGVAPNAKLRALVVPQGPAEPEQGSEAAWTRGPGSEVGCATEPAHGRAGRISWARLLKRVFDIDGAKGLTAIQPLCGKDATLHGRVSV
jgi:hypothetical protein